MSVTNGSNGLASRGALSVLGVAKRAFDPQVDAVHRILSFMRRSSTILVIRPLLSIVVILPCCLFASDVNAVHLVPQSGVWGTDVGHHLAGL
eukprot:437225-Pyramimonas_sp.AAC.1